MGAQSQQEQENKPMGTEAISRSPTIAASSTGPQDWFLLDCPQFDSAGDYISELMKRLETRQQFVSYLNEQLKSKKLGSRNDSVTDLGLRLRTMENTLQFRLAVLHPGRATSWFRKPLSQRAGPFASQLLDEPVFPEHDLARAGVIRAALNHCWQTRMVADHPFMGKSCLWSTLLELNAQLETLQILKYGDQTLRLRNGMSLPPELASPTLERFLTSLAGELEKARDRLDACFETLMAACVRFWDCQFEQTRTKEAAEERQRQQQARPQGAAAGSNGAGEKGSYKNDGSSKSHNQNPNFWQRTPPRRESAPLQARDQAALRFLGFEAVPTIEELRKRYLVLARRLHPDVNGGRDTDFKKLVESYQRLQNLTFPGSNVDLNTQL